MSTMSTEYPAYLLPEGEAREHSDMSPAFSDAEPDGTDPEAPWGRKADGTPKAKPGRPKGTPDTSPRTRTAQRRVRVAAAPRPKPSKQSKPRAGAPDYRPGIAGLIQLAAAPLAVAGVRSEACRADAAALVLHAETLAEAVQQTAEAVPQFAAVLDRVLSVGPYGALLAAAMPLAVQLAANHNLIPAQAAEAMGAMSRETLLTELQAPAQAA